MINVAPPNTSMPVCMKKEVFHIPADTRHNGKSVFPPVSFENKF